MVVFMNKKCVYTICKRIEVGLQHIRAYCQGWITVYSLLLEGRGSVGSAVCLLARKKKSLQVPTVHLHHPSMNISSSLQVPTVHLHHPSTNISSSLQVPTVHLHHPSTNISSSLQVPTVHLHHPSTNISSSLQVPTVHLHHPSTNISSSLQVPTVHLHHPSTNISSSLQVPTVHLHRPSTNISSSLQVPTVHLHHPSTNISSSLQVPTVHLHHPSTNISSSLQMPTVHLHHPSTKHLIISSGAYSPSTPPEYENLFLQHNTSGQISWNFSSNIIFRKLYKKPRPEDHLRESLGWQWQGKTPWLKGRNLEQNQAQIGEPIWFWPALGK